MSITPPVYDDSETLVEDASVQCDPELNFLRPVVFFNGRYRLAEDGWPMRPLATTTASGFMSPADKAKLDGLNPLELQTSPDGTLGWVEIEVPD